jgi:uracil-DNA glycosylase
MIGAAARTRYVESMRVRGDTYPPPKGRGTAKRVARSAADFLPPRSTLPALRAAAAGCTGCDLYRNATQTVFGEGPAPARFVFVGEQPGDQEDRSGHPFVGPAGRLLERALTEAGIPRETVYITNAVKHFKWIPRGKRRLHQRPSEGEIDACNPWLRAEVRVVKPEVLVCLGVTAARAAFGRPVRLKDYRGKFTVTALAERTFVTLHPSAILRLRDPDRTREYVMFVADLKRLGV